MPPRSKEQTPVLEDHVTVTRSQLVREIAERADIDRKAADEALRHFEQIVKENVNKGENVVLSGFLKFSRRATPARPARKGVNPFTGEMTTFKAKPASKAPRVTALKAFKDTISSGKVPKLAAKPAAKKTAKKAAAKKTAKKAGKKAAAKKTTAKKTTAKWAPARKVAAKRPAAKKTAKKATRRR